MPNDNRNAFDPDEGARLAEQICSRDIPSIDFDSLATWLRAAGEHLRQLTHEHESHHAFARSVQQLEHDLNLLRDDYRARITGLLKAIAIADNSRTRHDALAEIINSLMTMSAEELIACYRRTSAIFRDHFPATLPPLKVGQ